MCKEIMCLFPNYLMAQMLQLNDFCGEPSSSQNTQFASITFLGWLVIGMLTNLMFIPHRQKNAMLTSNISNTHIDRIGYRQHSLHIYPFC